jgi:hypothetical protein
MVIVRLLLFLPLATIGVALLLYVIQRDRRYLRFVWQAIKFTIIALAAILVLFAAERMFAPMLAPLF